MFKVGMTLISFYNFLEGHLLYIYDYFLKYKVYRKYVENVNICSSILGIKYQLFDLKY